MITRLKILVTGGRDYHNVSLLRGTLDDIALAWDEVCIISGGARGADELAKDWARDRGHACFECEANWNYFNKAAGVIRNGWMLDWVKPDLVLAFKGGKGTADMVLKAKSAGVWVKEVKDSE